MIEANLDDMNPQIYGYFLEKALAAGALDVYTTPVQMKKNRPGTLLTVLCRPGDTNVLMSLIFAETTTFGARTYRAQRRVLPREWVNVGTEFGRGADENFPGEWADIGMWRRNMRIAGNWRWRRMCLCRSCDCVGDEELREELKR